MNEPLEQAEATVPKPWYRKELTIFITGSITVALLLVVVSMAIYESSGAAQLDLSRPGYKSVQSKVDQTDTFEGFSASGNVTNQTLEQFKKLYDKQTKSVNDKNVFSPTALDDQTLGIDAPDASDQ